jgi:hypothetical protein
MNNLNFTKLVVIEDKRPVFYQLGSKREHALRNFLNVLERANCSLYFSAKFYSEANIEIKKGLLRGAIAEFVSIEEVISLDIIRNQIQMAPLKISTTSNPIFHLIKQLRNYNIHLGSSIVNYTEPKSLIRASIDDFQNGTGYKYEEEQPIIDNLSLTEFNKLRDSNRYSEHDKLEMINWFNSNQRIWGVGHLFYLAVLQYCDDIIKTYNLAYS